MKQVNKKIKLAIMAVVVIMGIIFSVTVPKVYAEDNTYVDMTEVTVTPVSNVVYTGNSLLNEQTIILKINSSHLFTEGDITNIKLDGDFHNKKIEDNILELTYCPQYIGKTKTYTKTYSINICGHTFSFEVKEKGAKISGANIYTYNGSYAIVEPSEITSRYIFQSTSGSSNIIVKGKAKQLSVKGLPKTAKQSDIKWKSSSPSIISVSKNGKIKAKKAGTAIITVSYKGNVISEVFFNSLSSKMKKVYSYARNLIKNGTYSQSKRMQKNYYDCSSFVWRSYANAGIYIGSKTYAPTYANIWAALKKSSKWIVKNSKNYKPQIGDIYEYDSMVYDVYGVYDSDGSIVYFIKRTMMGDWFNKKSTTEKYARYKAN